MNNDYKYDSKECQRQVVRLMGKFEFRTNVDLSNGVTVTQMEGNVTPSELAKATALFMEGFNKYQRPHLSSFIGVANIVWKYGWDSQEPIIGEVVEDYNMATNEGDEAAAKIVAAAVLMQHDVSGLDFDEYIYPLMLDVHRNGHVEIWTEPCQKAIIKAIERQTGRKDVATYIQFKTN